MKKHVILLAAALVMLASCDRFLIDDIQTTPQPRQDIALTKAQAALVPATREFTFDLMRQVSDSINRNIILSPFSLQAALSMASVGADGNTRDEINRAIGLDGFSADEVCSFYETLIPALLKVDRTVEVAIANSVWAKPEAKMKADYAKRLQDSFSASIYDIDNHASAEINRWVSKSTKGMIKKMDVDLEKAMMVLVNALYFNGRWTDAFEKDQNREEVFTNYDGSQKRTTFMFKEERMDYYYGEVASAINLPYGNEAYRMTIVIPNDETTGIDEVLNRLDEGTWAEMTHPTANGTVAVHFPKFECDFNIGLKPVMQSMGIAQAFENNAEFPFMAEKPLKITDIAQKAKIKVDEQGTEAAAVTQIEMGCTSAGPSMNAFVFKVNTPFFYAISEVSTGTILFAGVQKWM